MSSEFNWIIYVLILSVGSIIYAITDQILGAAGYFEARTKLSLVFKTLMGIVVVIFFFNLINAIAKLSNL